MKELKIDEDEREVQELKKTKQGEEAFDPTISVRNSIAVITVSCHT